MGKTTLNVSWTLSQGSPSCLVTSRFKDGSTLCARAEASYTTLSFVVSAFSLTTARCKRGVNRVTDQRILTVFSPGFRIQRKILTDLRILQLQRFPVFIEFWARSLDFACDKIRIVDLSDGQKCLVLFVFVFVCVCALL